MKKKDETVEVVKVRQEIQNRKYGKGKFIFKQTWISMCSEHQIYNPICQRCNCGMYCNKVKLGLEKFFHKYFFRLWFFYSNKR